MNTNQSECFMTPREATEFLRLSPGTLGNCRVQRKFLRFHHVGSRVRYRREDVKAFAIRGKQSVLVTRVSKPSDLDLTLRMDTRRAL
jgi:excisionase family DNA binding protein